MLTYQRFYFICHTGCCVTSLSPWWNDYRSLLCFPNCLVFSLALYVLDTKSKFTKNCSLQHGTGCKWPCSVNCCLNLLRSDSWNARTLPRLMLGQAHKARSTHHFPTRVQTAQAWGWFSVAVSAEWRELFWTTCILYIFVLFINFWCSGQRGMCSNMWANAASVVLIL